MPKIDESLLIELGQTGLKRTFRIDEEFLTELKGQQGIRVYREMAENDPVIGAVLFAVKQLLRQVKWHVEAAGESDEDREAARFLQSCMEDMSHTWEDFISEVLSMLVYGWSYFEIIYKVRKGPKQESARFRSQFSDGRIGWRKFAIRSQETLYRWRFDKEGGIQGMEQVAPPNYRMRFIPIEKALLFRTEIIKNNPEGRSVLRSAYRPWYFKRQIEEIEAIGIERDLAGLPVLTPPEGLNLWDTSDAEMVRLYNEAKRLIRNIRRDQQEGVIKPYGWTLELLSTGGRRQFDTSAIINRYDQRIAMSILADFILLGHEKVGSYALATSKTHIFTLALEGWLNSIASVINRFAVRRLFELNDFGIEKLPQLKPGRVQAPDLEALAGYIKQLAGAGMPIFPDKELENYLRSLAGLPEAKTDET